MVQPCNSPRYWVIDENVKGSLNLKPVTCDQYIHALEAALIRADVRVSACTRYLFNPVRAVQRKLGVSDLRETGTSDGVQ